jgi:transglutaminase/protease-like cytokinesis protein 3
LTVAGCDFIDLSQIDPPDVSQTEQITATQPELINHNSIISTAAELSEHIKHMSNNFLTASDIMLSDIEVWRSLNDYFKDNSEYLPMLGLKGLEIKYTEKSDYVEAELIPQYEMFMNVLSAVESGDSSQLDSQEQAVYHKALEIIESLISSDMPQFDKAYTLHKYLVQTIEYDHDYSNNPNAFNVYGALMEGLAVCQGYSQAFQMLLYMVGIEGIIITGLAGISEPEPENHAWNLVRFGVNWYHIDPTWNDQNEIDSHRFFAVPDSFLEISHSWNQDFFPAADSMKHNYFWHKGKIADSYTLESVFLQWYTPELEYIEILCTFDVTEDDLFFLSNHVDIEGLRFSIRDYGEDKLLTLIL